MSSLRRTELVALVDVQVAVQVAVVCATLAALCEVLGCQPGDRLRWEAEEAAAGLA